jgi:eukaryotic-like serine/threonine-protein kinase
MSVLPPGSKLGRFQIASVLGQGAMGVVYLANDPDIERPVAIKTVRPEGVGGENPQDLETRFLKEARLAGRLQHPNIVTVYDVGRDHGVCFIAMEYVDGHALTRYLSAGAEMPLSARVGIIRQVAEALGHAHERGVLHRDVKPGNILVAKDGRVKVTDFGIGKFTEASTSELTRTGHMVGSPAYMSPEQVKGEKLDGRSDLFSLGIVMYELLTGARPFPGDSITTLVYQILHTEPRDPLELKADLPIATREVVARLLAKAPDRRPANAVEFIRELKRIEKFQRESEMTRRAVSATPVVSTVAAVRPSDGAAATGPTASAGTRPAPPPAPPRSGMPVILALLAVLVAVSFLLLRDRQKGMAPMAAALPTRAPVASTPMPATAAPTVAATAAAEPSPLPTAAPAAAATPKPRATPRRKPTAAPAETPRTSSAIAAAPSAPAERPSNPDAVFATRRAVRFTSSPDQARLYVDGRYIGIADDWDNRGGGRELELPRGTHFVKMELPGYRPFVIEIQVTPESGKDSPSIDEEMDRFDRMTYERLPAPADRTTGPVDFILDPPDATVSEGGKVLGAATNFGPSSPLQIKTSPAVHDFVLSAPGYKSKLVRILVAGNAGKDRASVRETLRRE